MHREKSKLFDFHIRGFAGRVLETWKIPHKSKHLATLLLYMRFHSVAPYVKEPRQITLIKISYGKSETCQPYLKDIKQRIYIYYSVIIKHYINHDSRKQKLLCTMNGYVLIIMYY